MAAVKRKIKAHRRADGTKVKAHTKVVHVKRRGPNKPPSEKKMRRVGRQLRSGLKRIMREAKHKG